VQLTTSQARILEGENNIQLRCRAIEEAHSFPEDNLFLKPQLTGNQSQINKVLSNLRNISYLEIASGEQYVDRILKGEANSSGISGKLLTVDGAVKIEVDVSTASGFVDKLKPKLENAYVVKKLELLKNPNPSFKVQVHVNKGENAVYKPGEYITFTFQADKDCYLTLIDVVPSGQINILFPNAYHKDNKVKANRKYTIPSKEMEFQLMVENTPGLEVVKAIATIQPLDLAKINQSTLQNFKSFGLDESAEFTSELGPSLHRFLKPHTSSKNLIQVVPLAQWSSASVVLTVKN